MAKIDTHIHLGGTIPTSAIWQIISNDMLYLANSHQDVIESMTYRYDEPRTFHRFLDKFRILDEIKWTEEAIDLSIKAICELFRQQQMDYVWLDFSINKYMEIGWHKHEAIRFIYDRFEAYYPNRVGLILSLKYESQRAGQIKYGKLIDHQVSECLIGLDLVGDEGYFDADFYKPIINDWLQSGKMVRAHVGESQSIANIKSAIDMGVTNIAHGFKITEDDHMIQLALDKGISFDLSLISNMMTGVVLQDYHPVLDMVDRGLNITLGSDDPVIFGSNLDKEFDYAESIGLTTLQLLNIRQTAEDNTRSMLKSLNRVIPF